MTDPQAKHTDWEWVGAEAMVAMSTKTALSPQTGQSARLQYSFHVRPESTAAISAEGQLW